MSMLILLGSEISDLRLKSIRRCVYLMQSLDDRTLFRFGQIGAGRSRAGHPTDQNCAWARLRQCSGTWRVGDDQTPGRFAFVLLCELEGATSRQIRDVEKRLRGALLTPPRIRYGNELIVKRYRDKKRDQPRQLAPLDRIDAFVADDVAEIVLVATDILSTCPPHLAS